MTSALKALCPLLLLALAAIGQPVAVTDPMGKVWHFRYNPRGTVSSAWDPLGNTVTASYNIVDQATDVYAPPTGQTGPGSARQQSVYLYPGGPATQANAYDESGVLFRQTNFTYDAEGHLLTRTGAGEDVTLAYDSAYNLKTLKDGLNQQTAYTYNTKGQLTKIAYPGASGQTFDQLQFTSYDPVGNLLSRTDGRGIVTNYAYADTDGLLTSVTYPAYPSNNVSISYDSYDRSTTVSDGTGSSTASYDDLGNLTTSTRTYTGISGKTFTYAYYPDGSRQTMTNPAGTWSYFYDNNGRPSSMVSPAGTMSWLYLDNGWMSRRTIPNGTYTDYGYNAAGLLTSLANKWQVSGNTISSFGTFVYDGVFNLKNVTSTVPPAPTYQGTNTWTYDTKDRLLSEASTKLGGYLQGFGYDNAGNPTTFKGLAQSFNSDNQRNAAGYVFDGNGNPTTYKGYALTFDVENRMTSFGSLQTATYRSDGLRALKTASGSTTYYLYDGGVPVVEMNPSGATTAVNVFAPDGLVGRYSGSNWTFYAFDQQGNVSNRMDLAGTVLSTSAYDAYGLETSTAPLTDAFGYNAKWGYLADREIGQFQCMFRSYDPATGRWVNRDPIGYGGGVNVYGYCGSGPVGQADPTGLLQTTVTSPAVLALTNSL